MDNIKNVFKRMELKQIKNFILYGNEDESDALNKQPYEVRLKESGEEIYTRVKNLYSTDAERDKAVNEIDRALTTYEEVFMEIGIKAGVRIILQLLVQDETGILQVNDNKDNN